MVSKPSLARERKLARKRWPEEEREWQRVGFRTWDGKGGDSGDSLSDSLLSFLRAEILLGPRAASLVYVYTCICDMRYLRLKNQTFPSILFRLVSLRYVPSSKILLLDQLDFIICMLLYVSDFYIRNKKKNEYCTIILIYQMKWSRCMIKHSLEYFIRCILYTCF